jgi:uncharacterized protein YjbI with pentapeptide repeats
MPDFIRADLIGARFEEVDLTGARFRTVDLTGVKISGALLVNMDISGDVEHVLVNGVDVAPLVEAELNRRYPDRAKMRPGDAAGYREAWDILERLWPGPGRPDRRSSGRDDRTADRARLPRAGELPRPPLPRVPGNIIARRGVLKVLSSMRSIERE